MQSEFELETRVAQGMSRSRDGIGYETYGDTIGEVYDTLSGGRLRRVNLNEARSIAVVRYGPITCCALGDIVVAILGGFKPPSPSPHSDDIAVSDFPPPHRT